MEETEERPSVLPALVVGLVLFLFVILAIVSAKNRSGTVVLPGGITYLGPTPTPLPPSPQPSAATEFREYTGKTYPYSFSYPATMSLGVFPNDPSDSVTAFIPGTDSSANVFFRVEQVANLENGRYVGDPEGYARNWWKSYSWKGISGIDPFTNRNGLSGYYVSYQDAAGKTPYAHAFLTVPGRKDLMIWISGRLFYPPDFKRLADSVAWK